MAVGQSIDARAAGSGPAAYHRAELAIALTSNDERRLQPDLPATFESILDIGCGAGQTLIGCRLAPEVKAWGIDVDPEALRLGRELAPTVRFVLAPGERLPFATQSFDVVISRVALPYMHVPTALAEIARVLKPGGQVWLALHPFSMLRDRLFASLRRGDVKDVIYTSYILLNGALLHVAGRQLRFPLNRRRCESFQTIGGMTRALRACGLEVRKSAVRPFFVISAVKRS